MLKVIPSIDTKITKETKKVHGSSMSIMRQQIAGINNSIVFHNLFKRKNKPMHNFDIH